MNKYNQFLKNNPLCTLGGAILLGYILYYVSIFALSHLLWVGAILVLAGIIRLLVVNSGFERMRVWINENAEALLVGWAIPFIFIGLFVGIMSLIVMAIKPSALIPPTPIVLADSTSWDTITEVQYLSDHMVVKFNSGNSYLVSANRTANIGQKGQVQTWKKGDAAGRALLVEGWGNPQWLLNEEVK